MKNFVVYPAIFHKNEDKDGYWVEFPDLDGCFSEGETLEHTMQMAQEALGLYLSNEDTFPNPCDINNITADSNSYIVTVSLDFTEYRKKFCSKSIKKTLSIPEWLNQEAEKANINFSQTLQEALVKKLES